MEHNMEVILLLVDQIVILLLVVVIMQVIMERIMMDLQVAAIIEDFGTIITMAN